MFVIELINRYWPFDSFDVLWTAVSQERGVPEGHCRKGYLFKLPFRLLKWNVDMTWIENNRPKASIKRKGLNAFEA